MDKNAVGELGGGWLFAIAIILGGVGLCSYINIPSIVIVIGGVIAVSAAQFEADDLKRIMPALKIAFNFARIAESKLSKKYSKEAPTCKVIMQEATIIAV